MFALFMFGSTIENYWGHKRYLIYYMVTGVGAGLIQLLVMYITGVNAPTIGASGAVFGLLLAFGMLFPNTPLYLMFIPIPIKAKYMVIGYGLIEFFFGVSQFRGDNVAHYAHLGGMLFGIVLILYWNHDSYFAKLFNRFKTFFKRKPKIDASRRGFGFESDWNYNARKAAKSKEIDTILDKIKHSGYNSLTEEEKRKLFEQSKKE
jgi:hypothetical protein